MFRSRGTIAAQYKSEEDRRSNRPTVQRFFISHAYSDGEALAVLLKALPHHIEPVIFPPITVPPTQAVSEALIAAIRSCQGLIYLRSARSVNNFWVHFERRYALRQKMPVYGFDPASRDFRVDESGAANLIAPFWNDDIDRDRDRVVQILSWLQSQRSVYASPIGGSKIGYTSPDDPASFRRKFDKLGGTAVVFVSNEAFSRPWPFDDIDFFQGLDPQKTERLLSCSEVVWLGEPDLDLVLSPYNKFTDSEPTDVLLRRMIGRAVSQRRVITVELNGEINWNRVDDLLVHIEYWAHRQATLPFDAQTEDEKKRDLEDAKRELEMFAPKKDRPGLR